MKERFPIPEFLQPFIPKRQKTAEEVLYSILHREVKDDSCHTK